MPWIHWKLATSSPRGDAKDSSYMRKQDKSVAEAAVWFPWNALEVLGVGRQHHNRYC